jgi:hypothetical protein
MTWLNQSVAGKKVIIDFRVYPPRRIFEYDEEKGSSRVVINPNLKAVKGLPMHEWELTSNGAVVPRTGGTIPLIFPKVRTAMKKKRNWKLIVAIGLGYGLAIFSLLRTF